MATLILAIHILCVVLLGGISVGIGVLLPMATASTLPTESRLTLLLAVLDQARGPVLGAVAGIFITGFLNIASLQSGVGVILLLKMGIAVIVAAHALGLVNGVAGRLRAVETAESATADALAVLERGERSCMRLALSQLGLIALITLLSLNL